MPFLKRLDIVNEVRWRARIRPYIEVIPLTPSELTKKVNESALLRNALKYWIKLDLAEGIN